MSIPGGPIIPAVIIGGIAYELAQNVQGVPPGQTQYGSPIGGATGNDRLTGAGSGGGYSYDPLLDNGDQGGFNYDGRYNDPDASHKIDILNAAMEQTYANMSQGAKTAAAGALNQQLQLNPPLNGNETWQTVAKVAGGAAAGAACNLIPGVGTAASPLCAMAGAYLGVKLEEWMSAELPALKDWVADNIVSNVGDAVNAVGGYVKDGVDEVVGWVKGLF